MYMALMMFVVMLYVFGWMLSADYLTGKIIFSGMCLGKNLYLVSLGVLMVWIYFMDMNMKFYYLVGMYLLLLMVIGMVNCVTSSAVIISIQSLYFLISLFYYLFMMYR